MLLGEKIKNSVKQAGKSDEEAAVATEMSLGNLYKVYKRDSIETRYLVKLCSLLGVDANYFLADQIPGAFNNTGQANYANRVGSNNQSISIGEEDCLKQLDALKREKALLEKSLADKDMIIELLRGQKQG